MTRAEAIEAAVRRELQHRREQLDRDDKLGEIQITIKLQAGTTYIRGVVWQEERQWRSQ